MTVLFGIDVSRRFWSKVDQSGGPDSCWPWQGAMSNTGYSNFGIRAGHYISGHRLAYLLVKGPIPDGLHLDHLCRNKRCVNPAHLDAVPQAVNTRRAYENQDRCKNGHPYEGNVYYQGGRRSCVKCRREAARQYQARLRARAA